MTQRRLPLPSVESLSDDQRRVYDAIESGPRGTVPALFMAFLHNAELADRVQALGALLRYQTSLAPRLSELAILAIARHWSCQYEWHWHAPEAAQAGLPDTVIEAIKHRRAPPLSAEDEATVYDFSCELQTNRAVSDETYGKALALLGPAGVVELTALNGYYAMIAMTLNEHRIPLPGGASPQLPT